MIESRPNTLSYEGSSAGISSAVSSSTAVSRLVYLDHAYATLQSPRTLKQKYNNLVDNLSNTKQALYNSN